MEKLAKNKKYSSRISTYQIAHNLYLNGTLEYQKSTQIAFLLKCFSLPLPARPAGPASRFLQKQY